MVDENVKDLHDDPGEHWMSIPHEERVAIRDMAKNRVFWNRALMKLERFRGVGAVIIGVVVFLKFGIDGIIYLRDVAVRMALAGSGAP